MDLGEGGRKLRRYTTSQVTWVNHSICLGGLRSLVVYPFPRWEKDLVEELSLLKAAVDGLGLLSETDFSPGDIGEIQQCKCQGGLGDHRNKVSRCWPPPEPPLQKVVLPHVTCVCNREPDDLMIQSKLLCNKCLPCFPSWGFRHQLILPEMAFPRFQNFPCSSREPYVLVPFLVL